MEDIAPLIATLVMMWFITAIVRLSLDHRYRTRLLLTQADMHARLLDRIGTGPDALELLRTGAGLDLLKPPTPDRGAPHSRILGSIQAGIVIGLAGLAFLLLQGTFSEPDAQAGMTFVGGLALAVGVGFVASAVVAHRLSRAWGLLGPNGQAAPAAE
jgi:hypothetical protein